MGTDNQEDIHRVAEFRTGAFQISRPKVNPLIQVVAIESNDSPVGCPSALDRLRQGIRANDEILS